jgi:predicted ABC-type ATPase
MMSNIYIVSGPNGSGKTTVFPRLLPNFYFENVLNMSVQMRGRNVPIQSRVISTPRFIVGRQIESTVNTQLSFSFSTRPLTVNSQQSTIIPLQAEFISVAYPPRTLNDTKTANFILLWHRFRLRDNFSAL